MEIRQNIWKFALFNEHDDVIAPYEKPSGGLKWKFKSGIAYSSTYDPYSTSRTQEIKRKGKLLAQDAITMFKSLSLTCRLVYIDVVEGALLYRLHRFQFFYPRSLVRFLSVIPKESRNAMRDIRLAFPWSGPGVYHHVISPEALGALCTCTGLRKLSLVVGTSSGNRFYAQADYTNGGEIAIKAIEVLTTRLTACGLVGLEEFDILLWDPWPWQRHTPRAQVVGSGIWTEDAKISFAARHMAPAPPPPGQISGPRRDCWDHATKQKLERMVEKLRVQVTRPREKYE